MSNILIKSISAEYLYSLQPLQIQSELSQDKKFCKQSGLKFKRVITIADLVSVSCESLINAIRQALKTQTKQNFEDVNKNEISVQNQDGNLTLNVTDREKKIKTFILNEYFVLSPNKKTRVTALERWVKQSNPADPDITYLLPIANKRELTNEEVSKLIEHATNGVEFIQARIISALNTGKTNIGDLIPNNISYYYKFAGPKPECFNPETYIKNKLIPYRKELLANNLVKGIRICLIGSLRNDLMPTKWLTDVSDDSLWSALENNLPFHEPFSLLAGLDITLNRFHDKRFMNLALELINKLENEEFKRNDGVDIYELLPIFSQLTFDQIITMADGKLLPPYWRRMSSWMHACSLAKFTSDFKINVSKFKSWADSQITENGSFVKLLDVRYEPMFMAHQMNKDLLRTEVIGRLNLIGNHYKDIPEISAVIKDKIEAVVSRLEERVSPIAQFIPGPLDGHLRPSGIKDRKVNEEHVKFVLKELRKDREDVIWSNLAAMSQYFDFGDMLLNGLCEIVDKISLSNKQEIRQAQLENLTQACAVLVAHRNANLADSVANVIIPSVNKASTEDEINLMIQIIIYASGAFEDDRNWSEWLSNRLSQFAYNLNPGMHVNQFISTIRTLKYMVNSGNGLFSRPESIALSC